MLSAAYGQAGGGGDQSPGGLIGRGGHSSGISVGQLIVGKDVGTSVRHTIGMVFCQAVGTSVRHLVGTKVLTSVGSNVLHWVGTKVAM